MLLPIIQMLGSCKVSVYGRDNLMELLIKFITRKDGVGWSKKFIEAQGLILWWFTNMLIIIITIITIIIILLLLLFYYFHSGLKRYMRAMFPLMKNWISIYSNFWF